MALMALCLPFLDLKLEQKFSHLNVTQPRIKFCIDVQYSLNNLELNK